MNELLNILGRKKMNEVRSVKLPADGKKLIETVLKANTDNKLAFDEEENDFVVEITYEYDQNGNKISGEKEVEFTYYENGLISSELWKDEITDQIFFFISKYEFY